MYQLKEDGFEFRRAPHGARGLKSADSRMPGANQKSRPAWGAWIEIEPAEPKPERKSVAPRMGRVD